VKRKKLRKKERKKERKKDKMDKIWIKFTVDGIADSIPNDWIVASLSLATFKGRLKTFLFEQSFYH